mgnify:CR=1 FL=1
MTQRLAGKTALITAAGQGIGRALVQDFLAQARRRGAETAFLEVAESNTAARALYARAGFTESGRRRGYYHLPDGTPEDALVMTCTLAVREV